MPGPDQFSTLPTVGGVPDLGALRAQQQRAERLEREAEHITGLPHDWVVLATFGVPDGTLGRLRTHMASESDEPLPMDLDGDSIRAVDGPGCLVCEVDWRAGWDQPCAGPSPRMQGVLARQMLAQAQVDVDAATGRVQ